MTNPEDVSKVKDYINANAAFTASTQLETLKANVSMQTRFFRISLILLGVILLLISAFMLNSFSGIAILERKKEVAIIKSLGADNRCVLFVLLFDFAVISLMSLIFAAISFTLFNIGLSRLVADVFLINYSHSVMLIVLINLLFTVLVFILTGLKLRNLANKMPAELIIQ